MSEGKEEQQQEQEQQEQQEQEVAVEETHQSNWELVQYVDTFLFKHKFDFSLICSTLPSPNFNLLSANGMH